MNFCCLIIYHTSQVLTHHHQQQLISYCDFPAIMETHTIPTPAVAIISLLMAAAFVIAAAFCARKTKRAIVSRLPTSGARASIDNSPTMEKFFNELADDHHHHPVRFTAQQLGDYTDNYTTLLGSGGFGRVYKGHFPNGVDIAVKVLKKSVEDQFMAEVSTIGTTRHKNLVRLYGFCYENTTSALVYEYMENLSLDKHLFSDESREIFPFPWEKLHEIAVGAAKGMAYLHEECRPRKIIHYDIKPGNVLLDGSFSPKVADFGLARLCNRDDTHNSVPGYRGTPGYLAPEFFLKNFPISYKCDVYSFGILLFEMVGRRKNTRDNGGNIANDGSLDWFPKKVWEEFEKGELMELIIGACGIISDDKEVVKAERMAMVALWCVQDSPEARPSMSVVVKMLEGGVEVMRPPQPFNWLFSPAGSDFSRSETDDYTSSEGANSSWYK